MRFTSLFLFAVAGAISARSAARSGYVQHESRSALPPGWFRTGRLNTQTVIPVSIALAQSNIDRLGEYLFAVSDPKSPEFSRHWSAEKVAKTFAASEDTINAVMEWLQDAGFGRERVRLSKSRNRLRVDMKVEEAEALLDAEYHLHTHISGKKHIACDSYRVPHHIQHHIDHILPSVSFDATPQRPMDGPESVPRPSGKAGMPRIHHPSPFAISNLTTIYEGTEHCDSQTNIDCLRELYGIYYSPRASGINSYGIVEYTPQSYIATDLDMYFRFFNKSLVGKRPMMDSIDGGNTQTYNMNFSYNGESNLDLQYAMPFVEPLAVTLYQTGDFVEGASFNNFLDAIDGSYCTFEGGDDPSQDAIYPDTQPGGYDGAEDCGNFKATYVISTSYGYDEAELTPFYAKRQCEEYAKLGLQGISVLYSSGDNGVAGNDNACLTHNGTISANGTRFNPSFPPSCPYVTAVGATQTKPRVNSSEPYSEMACETVIYSGGGFSNVFARPAYQEAAVAEYLWHYPPSYNESRYNMSNSRAIPDVSANGANYVVAIDGNFTLVYGTSASSPVLGSVITLINDARLAAGKGPLGFLNPLLYANPWMFHDIIEGNNPGCGTNGFNATPGWDPVTGLGTPNFPRMMEFLSNLP